MTCLSDRELLREFAQRCTEAAFAELVRRHVDLVHSAARRLMAGCSHSAEDVTQQVFAELARQASRLTKHRALEAWLYTTTRFVAANTRRAEARRHDREQEFAAMNRDSDSSTTRPNWEAAARVLEAAMHDLDGEDRMAVLLRYFSKREFRAVGEALGVSEDAARMRVNRAVEKLQLVLQRRGVAVSVAGLGTLLATEAVTAAPMGLAASVCSVAAVTAAGTGTTFTLFNLVTMTKLQVGIIGAIAIASATTTLMVQHRAQAGLRDTQNSQQIRANELGRLQAENERLSNRAALASQPSVNNLEELQQLRDEMAGLQTQTNGLVELREENRRLKSSLTTARAKAIEDLQGTNAQKTVDSPELTARLDYCMRLGGALGMYARQHEGQYPTNVEQLAPIMASQYGDRTNFAGITPDQFEMVYQGPPPAPDKFAHPSDILRIREKQPWRNSDGKWVKVYVMITGVGRTFSAVDGNFEDWERRRIVPPEASRE